MPRPKTEAAEYRKLMLRVPETVHEACSRLAEKNRRSLNAQILYMLEDCLAQEPKHEATRTRRR